MEKRSIATMAVYTVLTLGIYQIVWLYKTKQELVAKGYNVPPFKFLFLPWILFAGIAVAQFVTHMVINTGNTPVDAGSQAINILSVVIGVIAAVLIIPITFFWYWRYCQATADVTNNEMPLGLSFGLLVLFNICYLGFVWPFIIQNSFNNIKSTGSHPGAPTPPTNPLPPTIA